MVAATIMGHDVMFTMFWTRPNDPEAQKVADPDPKHFLISHTVLTVLLSLLRSTFCSALYCSVTLSGIGCNFTQSFCLQAIYKL
jgi:hypothetical protein